MSTKDRLVDVAGRMFAERGFDGVSVREIIRAAGANLGAVTYHFGGKDGLFEEVVIRKTNKGKEIWKNIITGGDSPDVKLRKMLEAYAMYILHDEPSLKAMFSEMIAGGRRLPHIAVKSVKWRNSVFAQVMKEGIRKGIFRKCDTECATWNFFGMLASYILYQPLSAPSRRTKLYSKAYIRRIVDTAVDIFLNGVRAKGRKKA